MADVTIDQASTANHYQGTNRLAVGIVLAVVTFWLFAQTTLNVAPAMGDDLGIGNSISNIAVSIAALFSGIFIVVAGGLADHLGRVKFTNSGLALSVLGSLLIAAAAIFTDLSGMQGLSPMADIAMGRTDNLNIRFAAAIALLFNVAMVVVAMLAIFLTVPKTGPGKTT